MTHVRRLLPADLPGVLALQEANLFANLTPEQRAQGFLSVRFDAAQFERMDRNAAVVVAVEGNEVVGYACSDTEDAATRAPILEALVQAFPHTFYLGASLADVRTCIYGPACVRQDRRGTGLLRRMVNALREQLADRFDVAAGFIAKANTRSLAAHIEGAGMLAAGEFSFDGKSFWIVCFGIPSAALACGLGPRAA